MADSSKDPVNKATDPLLRPIIFLDIDGVLNRHKHATHIRLEDDLVLHLKRLVDETNATIVLSTFWRHFDEYIAYILSRYGIAASRVIGKTPGVGHNKGAMVGRSASDVHEYASRAHEIEAWLASNHNSTKRFVILDDRPSASNDNLKNHFVHVQTTSGLTAQNVDTAISILQNDKQQ